MEKSFTEFTKRLDSQDVLQRSDHDTLIRVEAKMDNLSTDVKIMGDGVMKSIADHEKRIHDLENVVAQSDPVNNIKLLFQLRDQIREFTSTAAAWRVMAGLLGGFMMFFLTQLPVILRNFGILK